MLPSILHMLLCQRLFSVLSWNEQVIIMTMTNFHLAMLTKYCNKYMTSNSHFSWAVYANK